MDVSLNEVFSRRTRTKKYKDETLQTRSSHMFKLVLFKFVTRCVSHLMEFDRHFYSYEKKRKCVGIIKLGAFCCCSINKIKGKGSGEMYKIGFLHNSNVVWVLKSIIFFPWNEFFFHEFFVGLFGWPCTVIIIIVSIYTQIWSQTRGE